MISSMYGPNEATQEGSGTGLGISVTYRKNGKVCSVYGTGTLTGALTANSTVVYTLPAGYRPPGNVVTPDFQNTNGSVRILSDGKIQSRVARTSGNKLLFFVTYVME